VLMLLLKRVECIKRSSYYLTKSNGAFNKGKTGASQQFLTESLHLFRLQDQGQLINYQVQRCWRWGSLEARFMIK
jgi:hypothetical protein